VQRNDRDFLQNVGGRTVTDSKADNLKPGEADDIDQWIKDDKKALRYASFKQALGVNTTPQSSGPSDLASTIVTKSIQATDNVMKRLEDDAARLQRKTAELESRGHELTNQMYQQQLEALKEERARIREEAEKAKNTGSVSDFDTYKKIRSEMDELMPPSPPSMGMNADVAIRLKELELAQQRDIQRWQEERDERDRRWQLDLMRFQDETKRYWVEIENKKSFRSEGLQGFSDLASSIRAAVSGAQNGEAPENNNNPIGSNEANLEASPASFPCQFCESQVTVSSPDDSQANCGKCGAQYNLRKK